MDGFFVKWGIDLPKEGCIYQTIFPDVTDVAILYPTFFTGWSEVNSWWRDRIGEFLMASFGLIQKLALKKLTDHNFSASFHHMDQDPTGGPQLHHPFDPVQILRRLHDMKMVLNLESKPYY